jgi:hypothetical protein
LLSRFPDSRGVLRPDRLVWVGSLTPAEYSDSYELVIDHQRRACPLVYVSRPRLQLATNQPLPHVYSWNTLCLFLDHREWDVNIPIADTLVPWASEWLFYYELWLASDGEWFGEGQHPAPGSDNRAYRRRYERASKAKFKRLTSALKLAYCPAEDLDELLYNARLRPKSVIRPNAITWLA